MNACNVDRRRAIFGALGIGLIMTAGIAHAQDGVTASEIRIGISNVQSGPAAALGRNLNAGAEAYFARVNAAGGVHGRKIVLVSKDDGYEPTRTASNTEALIGTDKVFALFNYVGTPTSNAAVPIASKAQVPYLFPFTGAEVLRTPVNKLVYHVRASYFDEAEEMVERLTKDLGVKKIAMFMQDDSFGEAVKGGIARALFKRGMKIHAETRFKRNTMEVEAGVAAMKQAEPEAIIFVGTYQQLAAVVKQSKAAGIKAHFMTVSFVGTESFIAAAGADGDGVWITQVVPSPHDASIPLVKDYLSAVKGSSAGYGSLEGWVNAAVLVEALKKAGPQPTREKLLDALASLSVDLGGMKIAYPGNNNQGSRTVYLTQVQGGKAVPRSRMN